MDGSDFELIDCEQLAKDHAGMPYELICSSIQEKLSVIGAESFAEKLRVIGTDCCRIFFQSLSSPNWIAFPLETLSTDEKKQYSYSQLSFWVLNYLAALEYRGNFPAACHKKGEFFGFTVPSCRDVWQLQELSESTFSDSQARSSNCNGKSLEIATALSALIDAFFRLDARAIVKLLYSQQAVNPSTVEVTDGLWGWHIWNATGRPSLGFPSKMLATKKSGALYESLLERVAARLSSRDAALSASYSLIDPSLRQEMNKEQLAALEMSLNEKFFILTGGPGTGKTYTLAKMVSLLRKRDGDRLQVALCAPTGKARERMSEMAGDSGCSLYTLHKLLKRYQPLTRQPSQLQPLPYHLVIVDEASMIDYTLFEALLQAVDPKTVLILVGDPNQLPPVEGISPFNALVKAFQFKDQWIVELKKSHRVRSGSMLAFAQALLTSDQEAVATIANESSERSGDFFCSELKCFYQDLDQNLDRFQVDSSLEGAMSALSQYRVLTSHNRGKYGVEAINHYLLHKLCKRALDSKHVKNLYIPILITQNQEELGIVNGQLAVVQVDLTLISRSWSQLTHPRKRRRLLQSAPVFISSNVNKKIFLGQVQQWDLGFALTVHKSQGSEYEYCTLVLPPQACSWGISILYTGFTRAKKKLDLYVEKESLGEFFVEKDSSAEFEEEKIATSYKEESRSLSRSLCGNLGVDLLRLL